MEIITRNKETLGKFLGIRHAENPKPEVDEDCPFWAERMAEWQKFSDKIAEETRQWRKEQGIDHIPPFEHWTAEKDRYLEERKYWEALHQQYVAAGKEDECPIEPRLSLPPADLSDREYDIALEQYQEISKRDSGMTDEEWDDLYGDGWLDRCGLFLSKANDEDPVDEWTEEDFQSF